MTLIVSAQISFSRQSYLSSCSATAWWKLILCSPHKIFVVSFCSGSAMGWLGLMTVMIENVLKIKQKPTTFLLSSTTSSTKVALKTFLLVPAQFFSGEFMICSATTIATAGRNDWISLAGVDNKVSLLSLKNRFRPGGDLDNSRPNLLLICQSNWRYQHSIRFYIYEEFRELHEGRADYDYHAL